ncbi:hypothetical protein G7046_g1726 [Stylonectria norvegica]|nr:hypothetical protein G7046_g1726 [Stylonectria norvegica]
MVPDDASSTPEREAAPRLGGAGVNVGGGVGPGVALRGLVVGNARTPSHQLHLPTPHDIEQLPAPKSEKSLLDFDRQHSPLPSGSSSFIPPVVPRLRNVPEKTKLFGQTHWLHTAEKFPVTGNFHPVDVEPSFHDAKAELFELVKETRSLRHSVKAQNAVKLEEPIRDLLSTLPSQETCRELINGYFRTLEPLYRVVHLPSFWKEYDQIWDPERVASPSEMFLMKLTLILAMGSTFYADGDDAENSNLRHLSQSWIQNAQWWLTGPSEKTTYNIDGLQVFCLLLIARQTTYNCPGATSWLSTSSLLRMAITMGLHRNPRLFGSLSLSQRETRARLWTTVLELSVQSSLDLALPINISATDYDATSPSNHNDVDFNAPYKNDPAPAGEFTDSSLQILLAKSLPLRIEVVRLLNDFKKEQSYEAALEIGAELRAACREVAAFFHSHKSITLDSTGDSLIRPTDFHLKFMDLQLRRFILFLHRDFMLQAKTNPRFYLSRKICVESSMVIASSGKHTNLGLPIADLDDLSRLSLVGRGLFKGALSFDAILVLALEIITQLDDEAAPQCEADALDEMAKATRAPLIQTLEHIHQELLHLLARGSSSMKRLLFVGAYLSQIRAMESGRPVKPAIYEAVTDMLKKCISALREIRVGATPQYSVATEDSLATDFFPMDFLSGDTAMDWDITNLLYFPTLNDSFSC